MAIIKCKSKSRTPRRPYDKVRLIAEMKLVGTYGLRNKKELWIIQKQCDDIKKRAKNILIHPDQKFKVVEGRILLNKLFKMGIFSEINLNEFECIVEQLESVLNLTAEDFLKRRLQYVVFSLNLASSVHHARNLVYGRQISVNGDVVNKPGYIVSAKDKPFVEIYQYSAKAGFKSGSKRSKKEEGIEASS